MKLKKFAFPALAVCMAVGFCMMSVACGEKPNPDDTGKNPPIGDNPGSNPGNNDDENKGNENDDKNSTYSITIEDNGASLTGLKVLFYSETDSKAVTITDKSASAELPAGNYVAYVTGVIPGYIYTPVRLSATQTEATISFEAVTVGEDGTVPYQVLYLIEPDKIFDGNPDTEIAQICTTGEGASCYNAFFDEFHIASLNMDGEQFCLKSGANEVHSPSIDADSRETEEEEDEYGIPRAMIKGYTFDQTKYKTPANGGFMSVLFDKK